MLILTELFGYCLIGLFALLGFSLLYLPVYFALRKKVSLARQLPFFFLTVCVFVVSTATFLGRIAVCLCGDQPLFVEVHSLNLVPFRFVFDAWDMGIRKQLTQSLANVLMFVPLGLTLPLAFKKARSFAKTTVTLLLFSLSIEVVQFFIGRSADIDDLMLNTLGGMLGYLAFRLGSVCFKNRQWWKKANGDL